MRPQGSQSDLDDVATAKLRVAIAILTQAASYAKHTKGDPWDFAVEIQELRKQKLSNNDLRLLVRLGYVQHASEVSARGSGRRRFRRTGDVCFTNRTCFVLTPFGIDAACGPTDILAISSSSFREIRDSDSASLMPCWDIILHMLSFDGRVVKQFKWCATNQEMILSVFQEEGWPLRIDDPLAPMPTLDVKRRLSDTIKCLNRSQQHPLIRFHGDGTGQGVIWKAATAKISSSLK